MTNQHVPFIYLILVDDYLLLQGQRSIYLIVDKMSSKGHGQYQKLNDLLSGSEMSSQDLLNQLKVLKQSFLVQQLVRGPEGDNPEHVKQIGSLTQMQKDLDTALGDNFSYGDLFSRTETAIFNQIIGIETQTGRIKEEFQVEASKMRRDKTRLESMKQKPDIIHSDEMRREKNKIFREQEFESVKKEIVEIQQKKEILNLLDANIENKIQALKTRNEQLGGKKVMELDRMSRIKRMIQDHEEYVSRVRQEEGCFEKIDGEQILKVLQSRLDLEARIDEQQEQKQGFLQLLLDFRDKYQEVQKKNSQLKAHLAEKSKR